MKKILVIKSDNKRSQLPIIINNLANNFDFLVFSSNKLFLDKLTIKQKFYRKGIPEPQTFGDYLFFTLISPIIFIILLIRLIIFRLKNYRALILTSLPEKIIITPWARILGYRVFWLENDYLPKKFKINIYSLLYRIWSKLAILIPTSQAIAQDLKTNYKITEENLHIINRGIDLKHLKTQSDIYEDMANQDYQIQNEALFIIGFVGDLKIENGVEFLVKSIEYFQNLIPDFQIIIVGDGPEKKNLHWLTKTLGFDKKIRFVGRQDNIQRWFKYFNILVFPRIKPTNFANTVAEAMATGIPVVSTKMPGIEEIVNHQGGILVEPKNAQKLAEAIFQIYNNKEIAKKFADQGQARIKLNYNLEKILEEYKKLLSKNS